MRVEFLPPAAKEVEEAVDWYERQETGLGERFRATLNEAVGRIGSLPESYPLVTPRSRRCVLRKFPYNVFYQVLPDRVLVLTVVHARRKPGHWRRRER